MGKRRPAVILERVTIAGAGAKGRSFAKVDGQVVFVKGAVPGDVVDVRVHKKRRRYSEGAALRILEPSPHRVEPFCKHFGVCGGCTWQDLAYAEQLAVKRQQVVDALQRIGGIEAPDVSPILPAPRTTHYRNKLEFSFGSRGWLTAAELASDRTFSDRNALGFHVPGRFDRILDLDECHLQPAPSDAIRMFIGAYAKEHGLTFFDPYEQVGFLRNLLIRTTTTGQTMVLISFGHEEVALREALLMALVAAFPELASVMWTINHKKNDTTWDLDMHVFHGTDHVVEELPDIGAAPLRFRIGPKTFFQTNPEQTVAMYALTRDLAGLTGKEIVYDLYCGAGSITLFLARHCRTVVGVELVPEAIADARLNAAENDISNVAFHAGDMNELLTPEFTLEHGKPDVVVVDPPRAGMHADVVQKLKALAPERIVYVSCDPATQARDIALLKDSYALSAIHPIDMFPHTHHVENVVLLVRREEVEGAMEKG